MKIINQYLAREVYTAMLVVIVVLLVVFLSNQFVRFMHFAAVGNLPGHGVKILLLLQLPILLAVLLPVSLFLAILLAYGRLYADSEMTVFVACGISPLQLLKITFGFSAIVMLVVALLALWINPKVSTYSDRILSGAISKTALDMVKPNSFTPILKDKLIFYVSATSQNKEQFSQVFAAQQSDVNDPMGKNRLSLVMAKSASQKVDQKTGDLYIILTDGYRYVGLPGQKDYEVMKYDEYAVRVPQDVGSGKVDASGTPTLQLWHERRNALAAAELQWRISLPLSALILTLLGTPLSKIRPRYGRYAKLVPAVLLYVTYANFLFLARAWMRSGVLSPTFGMWWVHGIMLIAAIVLIGQQIGWHRMLYELKIKNDLRAN
ncbi:lipopolysaccharide export system permease protein [Gammaproteobacteria bacterium]